MQSFSREREKLPLAGSSHCVFKGDRLSENYLPDSIFAPSVERCGPEMMMVSVVCSGNIHSPFPCKDRNGGKPECTRYIIWEWIFKILTISMYRLANILEEQNQNIIRAMTNTWLWANTGSHGQHLETNHGPHTRASAGLKTCAAVKTKYLPREGSGLELHLRQTWHRPGQQGCRHQAPCGQYSV